MKATDCEALVLNWFRKSHLCTIDRPQKCVQSIENSVFYSSECINYNYTLSSILSRKCSLVDSCWSASVFKHIILWWILYLYW